MPTPVEAVEVQLGFQGQQQDMASNERLIADVRRTLEKLGAKLHNNLIEVKKHSDVTYVTFEITGSNKVDVAFHLEEMVSPYGTQTSFHQTNNSKTQIHSQKAIQNRPFPSSTLNLQHTGKCFKQIKSVLWKDAHNDLVMIYY